MNPIRLIAALFAALILSVSTVLADPGLTTKVNDAYFPRTESASLHNLAHERVAYQIAYSGGVCSNDGSLTHDGLQSAEVLACNAGYSAGDGSSRAVVQWQNSPGHHALLSDTKYNLIGCAQSAIQSDGSIFYACTLSASAPAPAPTPNASQAPAPPQPSAPAPTPQPVMLPDTSTCRSEPVTEHTPTGIAGCVIYGDGTASRWPGPGVARNDCVYPWTDCTPITITSHETGLSITVTPTMFGDLYTGTDKERIVDLDPAAVEALGLNWDDGLYPVTVEPAKPVLPDTALPSR